MSRPMGSVHSSYTQSAQDQADYELWKKDPKKFEKMYRERLRKQDREPLIDFNAQVRAEIAYRFRLFSRIIGIIAAVLIIFLYIPFLCRGVEVGVITIRNLWKFLLIGLGFGGIDYMLMIW